MPKCMFCDCPLPEFKEDGHTPTVAGDACPDCFEADADQRKFEEMIRED